VATITRKIEIYIDEPVKEIKKVYTDKLFTILRIVKKFSNLCATHLFAADNISQFRYLTDEAKHKLTDSRKADDGILVSSYSNMLYEMSKDLPDDERDGITKILADTANRIHKTYNKKNKGVSERDRIAKGEISVKNYKMNVPIPCSKQTIELVKHNGNYTFVFHKIPFRTHLGKDRSFNYNIIDRAISGEYELCDSSIQYRKSKNKWFLLLTVKIPDTRLQAKEGVSVLANLSVDVPIIAACGKNDYTIGSAEEFLHQRLQIQNALHRLQKNLRYASGGKGRQKKLQAIDRFNEKEKNYVRTKMHTYSRMLVNFAVKARAEEIVLVEQARKEEEAKQNPFLLRNWTYYGLKDMIKYKAARVGINLVETKTVEEPDPENNGN
jgi:IS605 OrfB family transposase